MDAIEQLGAFAADKRAVAGAAKKSRLQELSNHLTRLIRVQVPQPLKLPVRQA
jgi:hypothetical protein